MTLSKNRNLQRFLRANGRIGKRGSVVVGGKPHFEGGGEFSNLCGFETTDSAKARRSKEKKVHKGKSDFQGF